MKFANSAAKSRPKSKLFHGVNLGPMGYRYRTCLWKKKPFWKYYDTVPLNRERLLYDLTLLIFWQTISAIFNRGKVGMKYAAVKTAQKRDKNKRGWVLTCMTSATWISSEEKRGAAVCVTSPSEDTVAFLHNREPSPYTYTSASKTDK